MNQAKKCLKQNTCTLLTYLMISIWISDTIIEAIAIESQQVTYVEIRENRQTTPHYKKIIYAIFISYKFRHN